ncbi:Holliday junction resolvase RecU [uncultured Tyzzerella sp.]|uniref:Holliday junction resolvase RecU n=1 Tax=uncultured Tyzzerella sp. TaxID=2321398 RepID=UPI0029425D1A|nr:Holliday junction resolvase RecU [uncultured Tyzzerella sp.]
MNNKLIGNDFEKEFALYLQDKGMFVYNLPNKYTGQPFDIIAVKEYIFFAFECKHCKGNVFSLSRVEDNQMQALRKLEKAKSNNYFFVFKFNDEIKFCEASYIKDKLKTDNKIHKDELSSFERLEELLSILL